jgi:glycosyltransferase involved in cell wall biosynthesis
MSRLKVIRLIPLLDFGGLESRIKITTEGFKKYYPQMDYEVVVLGQGGEVASILKENGFKIKELGFSVAIPNLLLIITLINYLYKTKPDVIHCSAAEANFHGLIASWITGVPVRIGEEIGLSNHDWKWRIVFKLIFPLSTKVISISEAVKNHLVIMQEVKAKKVHVLYNPISENLGSCNNCVKQTTVVSSPVNSSSKVDSPFIFIVVCRLVKIKNIEFLIQSFDSLFYEKGVSEIQLWIVGDGDEMENCKDLVNRLNLQDYVLFFGYQKDVTTLLKVSNVFVLPSFSEGFSNALIEAMSLELIGIVTKIGGPSEIIKDKQTGYLIDPYDTMQLKEVMFEVYQQSIFIRKRMGKLARKDVMRFSLKHHLDALFQLYTH